MEESIMDPSIKQKSLKNIKNFIEKKEKNPTSQVQVAPS